MKKMERNKIKERSKLSKIIEAAMLSAVLGWFAAGIILGPKKEPLQNAREPETGLRVSLTPKFDGYPKTAIISDGEKRLLVPYANEKDGRNFYFLEQYGIKQ